MVIHSKNKQEAQKDIENYRHLLAANADMVTLDTIQEQASEFKEVWNQDHPLDGWS